VTDFYGAAGEHFTLEVGPVTRPDTGAAVDLSLANTHMWFVAKHRRSDGDSEIVFEKTEAGGISLNLPVTAGKNMATVTVAPGDLQAIVDADKPDILHWDAWLKEPDNRESRVDYGFLKLSVPVKRVT
jgi:hypothetical protein